MKILKLFLNGSMVRKVRLGGLAALRPGFIAHPLQGWSVKDVSRALDIQKFIGDTLAYHGFFVGEADPGRFNSKSPQFREGLRNFQRLYKIEVTGRLNSETLGLLCMRRCAHFQYYAGEGKSLHRGNPWPKDKKEILYQFSVGTGDTGNSDPFVDIEWAIQEWNKLNRIVFNKVDNKKAKVDLEIGWSTPSADKDGFGLVATVAAHAVPCGSKNSEKVFVHLNDEDHSWTSSYIRTVVLHELGHILGFCDDDEKGRLMYHTFDKAYSRSIGPHEKELYEKIYS